LIAATILGKKQVRKGKNGKEEQQADGLFHKA
jgi:hypothetical protein